MKLHDTNPRLCAESLKRFHEILYQWEMPTTAWDWDLEDSASAYSFLQHLVTYIPEISKMLPVK